MIYGQRPQKITKHPRFKRFFRPQDFNTVKAAGSNILKALDPNDQTFKVILRPRTSEEVAKDEDNKCL